MQGFPLKVLISAGKGFILCTVLIFASCDNFLEGAGLKRSLDDSITVSAHRTVMDGNFTAQAHLNSSR